MKTAALWLAALAIALLMAFMGPIDDGAQVIAVDLQDAISMARVAAKEPQ